MLNAIFTPFLAILFAELLDKSQLTILLLSNKTKNHLHLLLGVISAFVIVDGSAVVFGSLIKSILPENLTTLIAGILFILFAILSLRPDNNSTDKEISLTNPLMSGFILVFFSEWGDKTQLATAAFASHYPPIYVFMGIISALFLLSVLSIYAGSFLLSLIPKQIVTKLSGVTFLIIGIYFILQSL